MPLIACYSQYVEIMYYYLSLVTAVFTKDENISSPRMFASGNVNNVSGTNYFGY